MFSSDKALEGSVAFSLVGQRAKHSLHSAYHILWMSVSFIRQCFNLAKLASEVRLLDSFANFCRYNRPSLLSVTPDGSGIAGAGITETEILRKGNDGESFGRVGQGRTTLTTTTRETEKSAS